MPAVSYHLEIDGERAGEELLSAVQQIEVENHARMADMMRLQLALSVQESGSAWTILDQDLFRRLSNLRLEVAIGSNQRVPLIDAYVIETSASFSNEPGKSVLTVVAMDATVLMNLEEKVRAWPNMADSDIASAIFGDYGFTADVEDTQPSRQEIDTTTIQRGTDIQFLRRLARRNGCDCYVKLNPNDGSVEGHFHRPRLDEPSQGTLSVNMGPETNVNSFRSRYEMLRPVTARVTGLDIGSQSDQAASVESSALMDLGSEPVISDDRPRRVLISQSGLSETGELQTMLQALVDNSSWAIVAEGELNTVAYENVLRASSPLMVRGIGRQFSGTYFVERVLHVINGDGYIQRFSLRRNALGLTGGESFVQDSALPS